MILQQIQNDEREPRHSERSEESNNNDEKSEKYNWISHFVRNDINMYLVIPHLMRNLWIYRCPTLSKCWTSSLKMTENRF